MYRGVFGFVKTCLFTTQPGRNTVSFCNSHLCCGFTSFLFHPFSGKASNLTDYFFSSGWLKPPSSLMKFTQYWWWNQLQLFENSVRAGVKLQLSEGSFRFPTWLVVVVFGVGLDYLVALLTDTFLSIYLPMYLLLIYIYIWIYLEKDVTFGYWGTTGC